MLYFDKYLNIPNLQSKLKYYLNLLILLFQSCSGRLVVTVVSVHRGYEQLYVYTRRLVVTVVSVHCAYEQLYVYATKSSALRLLNL